MDIERIHDSLRDWHERGRREGGRFLLVWQDRFDAMDGDLGLYPEFAADREGLRRALDEPSTDARELMEIFDLRRGLDEQLSGPRKRSLEDVGG